MNHSWIKTSVWLCLIVLSNPVIYANALIPMESHSMHAATTMSIDEQSCHHGSTSMEACYSPVGDDSSDGADCCMDYCDCGASGCRVQPCSLNTSSFPTSGSAGSFESPLDNYALSFPSGLYRPPSTPL